MNLLERFLNGLNHEERERLWHLHLQKKQEICRKTVSELEFLFPDQEIRVTDEGTYVRLCFKNFIPKDELLKMSQLEDLTHFHNLDFSMGVAYDVVAVGSMMTINFVCNERPINKINCSYFMTVRKERRKIKKTCLWKNYPEC